MLVHQRRVFSDFPLRPVACQRAGEPGISRFAREVFPCMREVCDPVGSPPISR
jgi:hypothetical protein